MVYKFSIINSNNKEKILYLSADSKSRLYQLALHMYGILKEDIRILAEYEEVGDDQVKLLHDYTKAAGYSEKVVKKASEIFQKQIQRSGQYKQEYIKKYNFSEQEISGVEDLYPLVNQYKKVKVYWERLVPRGPKRLYALYK